eukprot:764078-Karenia_brevis.AAC.1
MGVWLALLILLGLPPYHPSTRVPSLLRLSRLCGVRIEVFGAVGPFSPFLLMLQPVIPNTITSGKVTSLSHGTC